MLHFIYSAMVPIRLVLLVNINRLSARTGSRNVAEQGRVLGKARDHDPLHQPIPPKAQRKIRLFKILILP